MSRRESSSRCPEPLHFYTFSDMFQTVASLAPNSTLIGSESKEAALVDQWVAFSDSYVTAYNNFIVRLVQGHITPYSKPVSQISCLSNPVLTVLSPDPYECPGPPGRLPDDPRKAPCDAHLPRDRTHHPRRHHSRHCHSERCCLYRRCAPALQAP